MGIGRSSRRRPPGEKCLLVEQRRGREPGRMGRPLHSCACGTRRQSLLRCAGTRKVAALLAASAPLPSLGCKCMCHLVAKGIFPDPSQGHEGQPHGCLLSRGRVNDVGAFRAVRLPLPTFLPRWAPEILLSAHSPTGLTIAMLEYRSSTASRSAS